LILFVIAHYQHITYIVIDFSVEIEALYWVHGH